MSFLPIEERDQRLLTKLQASSSDLGFAQVWAEHLLAKKWFRMPWSRGKIYTHQSAYVTAIVVAYARVFANGKNGYNFPKRLIRFDAEEQDLHDRLLGMRHKIYAHSDLDKWSVRPWKVDDFETVVVGAPMHKIEESDLRRLVAMIGKLHETIGERYQAVLEPYWNGGAAGNGGSAVDAAIAAIMQLEVGEALAIRVASPEADDEDKR